MSETKTYSKETTLKIHVGLLVTIVIILCVAWSDWKITQDQVRRNSEDIKTASLERVSLRKTSIMHTAYFEAIMTTVTELRADFKESQKISPVSGTD